MISLLDENSDKVRVNVIQIIANCSEDHPGRGFFTQTAKNKLTEISLKEMEKDLDQLLVRSHYCYPMETIKNKSFFSKMTLTRLNISIKKLVTIRRTAGTKPTRTTTG